MGAEAMLAGPLSSPMTESVHDDDQERERSRERHLLRRAAAGDKWAFQQLVSVHQRPIAALIQRLARHPDDVEDILQETILRAWKGLPTFRGEAKFSTWLYRIAVNTTFKWQRRHAGERNAVSLSDWLAQNRLEEVGHGAGAETHEPEEALEQRERSERLRAAVAALPPKQRDVVTMHYFDGQTCDEIGAALGCSVGTVWSRLHYACKRLRATMVDW